MTESLDNLIKEKAEAKFDKNFCSGFTDKDWGRVKFSSASFYFTDEEKAFDKIRQTQEYKDFKEMMVKKYIKEIQKEIIKQAGE